MNKLKKYSLDILIRRKHLFFDRIKSKNEKHALTTKLKPSKRTITGFSC